VTHLERFDLEVPDDFPGAAIESLHGYLSDRRTKATEAVEWREWTQAVNGIVFRFRACDEDCQAALESIRRSNSPPQPERYNQERWLFGFFFQGYSAIECFYYGMFFVGAIANPEAFVSDIPRKQVTPRTVASRFGSAFPGTALATAMNAVVVSAEFEEWGIIRNILGHRGAPGRAFFSGGPEETLWNLPLDGGPLRFDPSGLEERRRWLGEQLNELASLADFFAREYVPEAFGHGAGIDAAAADPPAGSENPA
jgi:hypothetical protein